MPKSNRKTAKPKTKTTTSVSKPRQITQPQYKSFRISKKIQQPNRPLTGSFRLLWAALGVLKREWRLFGGIVGIYLVLTQVLVKGLGVSSNIGELKASVLQGGMTQLATGFTLFGVLLGNANSAVNDVAGAYQSMLLIIISLALIWALRQTLGDTKVSVTVRDTFYKGLYPVVPFLLVLAVIGLQLLPLVVASFLYSSVIGNGLAVTAPEQWLWWILFGLLALLSLYMVTSSVFALYIVTLPGVRPMQALRSARELVRFRRWIIMRKVIFLPVALLVLTALIIIPLIIIAPGAAEWVFVVLSMLGLAVVHSYFYHLYKELLG